MAVRRSRPQASPYNQTAIADCGHWVVTWPLLCDLGGRNPRVVCEECTRAAYGIDVRDKFIFVKLKEQTVVHSTTSEPRKRATPAKKAPRPRTGFLALLDEEGLLGGP